MIKEIKIILNKSKLVKLWFTQIASLILNSTRSQSSSRYSVHSNQSGRRSISAPSRSLVWTWDRLDPSSPTTSIWSIMQLCSRRWPSFRNRNLFLTTSSPIRIRWRRSCRIRSTRGGRWVKRIRPCRLNPTLQATIFQISYSRQPLHDSANLRATWRTAVWA